MKRILPFLLFLVTILTGCGGQKPVTIQTMRPADISIDPSIQTVLLIDRTKPSKKGHWVNIGEGLITGEMPEQDKAAAQELLNSLKNALQSSPRYEVLIASERLEGNSLTAAFPEPLPEHLQFNMLNRYRADALIVLEVMDSDFIITEGKRRVKKTVGSGKERREIEVDEYYAEGVGNIKVGIRLYNPRNKELIDQQLISQTNTWRGAADSKAGAIAALISRSAAVRELCAKIGHDYAYKVAPMPVTLRRVFYTKSKNSTELEAGGRLAEVGQWQEAIMTWESGIKNAIKPKDAGRMAYNIAVAYEVLGDLEKAYRWAQDAYVKYGNKQARTYAQQLSARMNDEQTLQSQLQ
jgi:tetratricopeptide (TPR) repeat protein